MAVSVSHQRRHVSAAKSRDCYAEPSPTVVTIGVVFKLLNFLASYDTTRYGRFTCAQKLMRWPA